MYEHNLKIDGIALPDRLVKRTVGLIGGQLRIEGVALDSGDKQFVLNLLEKHPKGSLALIELTPAFIEITPTDSRIFWHGTYEMKVVDTEVVGSEPSYLHYWIVAQKK